MPSWRDRGATAVLVLRRCKQSGVLAAVDPPAAGPAGDAPAYTPMPAPVIRRQSLLTPAEAPASNEADSLWASNPPPRLSPPGFPSLR